MKVTRVNVQLLGARNFPLATGKIPEELCHDFGEVYAAALVNNPTATPEDVVRAIWRYGTRATRKAIKEHISIKTEALPPAQLAEPANVGE